MVTFEEFNKFDFRIGKVISVERIPDTDKLLKFVFDLGNEQRQIIAGMAPFFPKPSSLVGKKMPLLINIKQAKFKGYVSEGMILAVDADEQPVLLKPEKDVPAGSKVR